MGFIRRHSWWLLPELVVLAILSAFVIAVRGNGLEGQLSDRAQTVLERLSLSDHDLRGPHVEPQDPIMCAAEVFGMEPAGAQKAEDVRVIYAHYLCAVIKPGMPWDYATRSTGPAVITLTDPPTVRIIASGAGYEDRVRAAIPDDLEAKALASFSDPGRPAALLERYKDATT